jgi:adenylate cyclase
MSLRVTIQYKGAETVREFDLDTVLIGRLTRADGPGLDLSDDASVSRRHALIEVKEGVCWLTDLGSSFGTTVNGQDIRGRGPQRVWPEDTVSAGETTLRLALVFDAQRSSAQPSSHSELDKAAVQITRAIDTTRPRPGGAVPTATPAERRLALLLELPEQFGAQTRGDALLQLIMDRVVAVIPNARRGALLLRDPQHNTLLLKAYVSPDEPAVSETLARRALAEKRGFLWHAAGFANSIQSVRQHHILHGMYAPLEWRGEVFGVICVDSPLAEDSFQEQDLEFLLTIGRYAAMALTEQRQQTELEQCGRLTKRLLANFSTQVRARLIEQARQGKLRPGGAKSQVTLLFCDICGFTNQAAQMDPQDIVEMLNHYFGAFVQIILSNGGTIDKFIGDAVLAVFGSPEPDPRQHEKALRSAFAIQAAVADISRTRAARGEPDCQVSVGLHCGEVFHGFIGAMDRLEFTVIGDAVNRACRYCDAAAPGEVLASADLFQRVFNLVKAEKVPIQTKEGELVAYRVKSLKTVG